MTLGRRIQQIRKERGLSQEEFGGNRDARQTVSRWELDQTYPGIAKIERISRIFSVSTDSLLRDGISTFDEEENCFLCGVYRGGQFFGIRNYKDNSEKWSGFRCDFSREEREIKIPADQCESG